MIIMKAVLLLSIIPFFFLFLLIPAHAYLTPTVNVSYVGSTFSQRGFVCSNLTGTVYCYVMGCPSTNPYTIRVERFNSTLGDYKYCTIGLTEGSSNCEYEKGWSIANNTHLIVKMSSGKYRLVDISNMSASTTCTASAEFSSHLNVNNVGGGFYYVSNSSGYIYWGDSDDVKNSTTGDTILARFWNAYEYTMRLPNQTDNSTIYVLKNNSNEYYRYDSGSMYGYFGTALDTFGADPNGVMNWDLMKENASTTWIYYITGSGSGGTLRLIKANFSKILEQGSSGTIITAISPLTGAETVDSPQILTAELTTSINGSLVFYFNGSLVSGYNQTITGDASAHQYTATTGALTNGETYSWFARFTDQYGNAWNTNNQSFTYTLNSYSYLIQNPANGFALLIGGIFSETDLETSQEISSIFLSIVLSLTIVLGIGLVGKGKMHSDSLLSTFGITLMGMLIMFTLMGWFPSWLVIILLVISAYAFVKLGKVG